MREYHEVFGHELPPLPQEPVLSDFYTRLMNSITESWDSLLIDWDRRSPVLSRELNYITSCNIIIF